MFNHTIIASRLRRTRFTPQWRALVAQNTLTPDHLIAPLFVVEGENQRQPVPLLHIERYSIDTLIEHARQLVAVGINTVALFPCIDAHLKDATGSEGLNPNNLMCRAVRALKNALPQLMIMADVALDPYTSHGHDGPLDATGQTTDNTATIDALLLQARHLAQAGADALAPSDMCDGRIGAIRHMLETNGHTNTLLISYCAKYASTLYTPFRSAAGSAGAFAGSKSGYQMDVRNSDEALREAEQDITEGADMLIVKPGLPYLDIVYRLATHSAVPVLAYHVSGEFAMLRAAAAAQACDYLPTLHEMLLCFRRAGCKGIITYGAYDMALALA